MRIEELSYCAGESEQFRCDDTRFARSGDEESALQYWVRGCDLLDDARKLLDDGFASWWSWSSCSAEFGTELLIATEAGSGVGGT